MHSQVLGWTHLRVHQNVVAESWDSEGAPDFQHYKGVKGHARSPDIRLGRGTRRSSLNLHPKQTTKWFVHIPGHPWVLGQATSTSDHKTHHGPDSGEATTFPHIVFFATLYIQMALFPKTPKLESRNCPEIVPVGVLGLWTLVTPDCRVWSQQGLNQSCNPRRDLSNAMLHSQFGGQEEVDSRLFVVGSQTTNFTPSPSFTWVADVQMANARCFGPWCRTLNIRESRRTPNPQLWECWASPPRLAKVGLRHLNTVVENSEEISTPIDNVIGKKVPFIISEVLSNMHLYMPLN